MMTKRWLIGFLMLTVMISVAAGAASGQWLHVRVMENGESGEKVKVNVPMSLIETVLPMIEPEGLDAGKIKIDSRELTVPEIREIWNAVRSSGDYEIASVQNNDVDLRITIEGDYLLVRSTETARNKVSVTVPARVVDALLSGDSEQLDLLAAVEELAMIGNGELVTVEDGDTMVKIWIDSDSNPAE